MSVLNKNSFENINVAIIGDVMIDRYYKGKVERISPEAPVPVHLLQNIENRLGGAANVALNIKTLGATPFLISIIGNDADGKTFKELLAENNINSSQILIENKRITTTKTRVVAGTQQLLRIDYETTTDITISSQKKIIANFNTLIVENKINVVIFQDYNKGVLTKKLIHTLIDISNTNGILTCVDPKKKNFWEYKNVSLFKPNLKEISEAFNTKIKTDIIDLDNIHKELKKRLNHTLTFITLSDKGIYANDDKASMLLPTKTKNIVDVSGAGDSVISIASLCLAKKMQLETICNLSNMAGGIVCEQSGVAPIFIENLIKM
jgi:D-glycero-beta-D-manno-heptose-7-phosphate kinase